ncbi:ABC transporter ATP-binding protein [Arsenicitalea aurantiaca]|uniref:ABC transporter ATP-binding protein n=1 Tax=Arsenicitalea aurantiaca TaxID=1783274 RepID=UPI00195AC72E|nr:ABC transporter ATP-binding protein [Arsenicitalea aurantiaca]
MFSAKSLVKSFDAFRALGPLSFSFGTEHVLGVVGPSGCGKSTLLRLIAGLEAITWGTMELDGDPVTGARSDIAVVFQEPRLLPWASVRDNVGLGLWHLPRAQRQEAVDAALRRVNLFDFADALPKQLSGGMAQRVGIARALVAKPRLLLLDEPFAALDPLTRVKMQDHLLDIVGDEVPNVLLITHDIEEALVLSDRIIVLDGPPARIVRDIAIDLPKPRHRTGAPFQAHKAEILETLFGAADLAA